jgi:hypothetical protein
MDPEQFRAAGYAAIDDSMNPLNCCPKDTETQLTGLYRSHKSCGKCAFDACSSHDRTGLPAAADSRAAPNGA